MTAKKMKAEEPDLRHDPISYPGEKPLTKHERKKSSTKYQLPGGKPEEGEALVDAALREVAEEVGLTLDAENLNELGTFDAPAANEPGEVVVGTIFTYARAVNSEHQMELLNKVAEFFVGNEYRLLIIDSIMALFRVDYTGRGELNERQQKLNQFLSKLTHVAEGM